MVKHGILFIIMAGGNLEFTVLKNGQIYYILFHRPCSEIAKYTLLLSTMVGEILEFIEMAKMHTLPCQL